LPRGNASVYFPAVLNVPDVQTDGVETQNGKGPGMDTNAAFLDPGARRRLFPAFLMMLSVTFGFWGVATFVPTYVGTVAAKAGIPRWRGSSALELP
jgi:hypothetical protein